jgi:hypothetical protein
LAVIALVERSSPLRGSGVWVDAGLDVTGVPLGGVPVAVAVLSDVPAFTSSWVMVWVPVQDVLAFGANVVALQAAGASSLASFTTTLVRFTLPVLVITKV